MPERARYSRKKLLMPLVELSLPERSGVEQSRTERSQYMPPSVPMPGAEIYLFSIGGHHATPGILILRLPDIDSVV